MPIHRYVPYSDIMIADRFAGSTSEELEAEAKRLYRSLHRLKWDDQRRAAGRIRELWEGYRVLKANEEWELAAARDRVAAGQEKPGDREVLRSGGTMARRSDDDT